MTVILTDRTFTKLIYHILPYADGYMLRKSMVSVVCHSVCQSMVACLDVELVPTCVHNHVSCHVDGSLIRNVVGGAAADAQSHDGLQATPDKLRSVAHLQQAELLVTPDMKPVCYPFAFTL